MNNQSSLPPVRLVLQSSKSHQRSGECLPGAGIKYLIDFEGYRYEVVVATQQGRQEIRRIGKGSRRAEPQSRYRGKHKVS